MTVRLHKEKGVPFGDASFFDVDGAMGQGVTRIVILPMAGQGEGAYNQNISHI